MNAQTQSLSAALASAFAEFEAATKDASNPHFKSKYADLPAVMGAVKPALVKHGLFFTQETHDAQGGVCVETVIRHASGESLPCGKLFVPANKNDAQGYGSALTYARRYSLMTAFGIPAEDDDGNAAARGMSNGNGRVAANGGAINDAQWAELTGLLEASGSDARKFCEYFGVSDVRALPAAKFAQARDAILQRAQKNGGRAQ